MEIYVTRASLLQRNSGYFTLKERSHVTKFSPIFSRSCFLRSRATYLLTIVSVCLIG